MLDRVTTTKYYIKGDSTMNNIQQLINERNENPKSTGILGKCFECAVKELLSGRHRTKIRPQGKTDAYFTFKTEDKRKCVTVEIKTACGEIDYCTKSQYIIYAPEVNLIDDIEEMGFVFTREEWVNFINGYTGRGKFTRVTPDGKTHIQSFYSTTRPKASKPIADYIWNACFDQPTIAQWIEELRG